MTRVLLAAGVAFGAAAAAGCGDAEAPAPEAPGQAQAAAPALDPGNQPPVVESLEVEPRQPVPGDTLRADARAVDPDGDPLRLFFSWSVNGRTVEVGTSPAFRPEKLGPGDRIAVEVVASDGRLESEPRRVSLGTGNRPPILRSARIDPAEARPGEPLRALVDAEDPDGDALRFEYTWHVNGKARKGSAEFDTKGLRRGDEVELVVVATDGRKRTPAVRSAIVEMRNSPPVFAGVPAREEVDGVFFYKLDARDPDGDRSLRYRLAQGPPGMSIDPLSGVVRWQPQVGQQGEHPVEVVVRDRHGDESFLRWKLTVSVQQAPASGAGS